jgi:putative tryptophan/tyrosine transport system substrate-binding protein
LSDYKRCRAAVASEAEEGRLLPTPHTPEAGGMAAYGPQYTEVYRRQIARQLVKIFRGARPADIPVEQPDKFELVINLRTASALGLTVPQSLLARADEVIE